MIFEYPTIRAYFDNILSELFENPTIRAYFDKTKLWLFKHSHCVDTIFLNSLNTHLRSLISKEEKTWILWKWIWILWIACYQSSSDKISVSKFSLCRPLPCQIWEGKQGRFLQLISGFLKNQHEFVEYTETMLVVKCWLFLRKRVWDLWYWFSNIFKNTREIMQKLAK